MRTITWILALAVFLEFTSFAKAQGNGQRIAFGEGSDVKTASFDGQKRAFEDEPSHTTARVSELKHTSAESDVAESRGSFTPPSPSPAPTVTNRTTGLSGRDLDIFALALRSEANRYREQELVAWVIRNRVETGFRSEYSYRSVIEDPWQFSDFNDGVPWRLYPKRPGLSESWQKTRSIARNVAGAPASERPFPIDTRHFFSRQSMPDDRSEWPGWTKRPWEYGCVEVEVPSVPKSRFRFFRGCESGI